MKQIPLTQGEVALVDDCDHKWLTQWKWFCSYYGYAVRSCYENGKRSTVYMHREIIERVGPGYSDETDHRNRDKFDNRRDNLRPATYHQNKCNQGRRRNNSSGYIGVSWFRLRNKWRATVYVDGRQKHLGYYDDPRKAAKAYNKAVKKHRGDFAVLNEVAE